MATETTTLIEPFAVGIDVIHGVMANPERVTVRKASDMRGYYEDGEALEQLITSKDDPVHYRVFETPVPEEYGHLMFCISKLEPGVVGEECFMTKGHFHTVEQTGETYLCLQGEGYMVMKTSSGEARAVRMLPNQMVYVPPYWAHRSVNSGDTPLISFCVYGAEAGHNYGDIKTAGFPTRVYMRDGLPLVEHG